MRATLLLLWLAVTFANLTRAGTGSSQGSLFYRFQSAELSSSVLVNVTVSHVGSCLSQCQRMRNCTGVSAQPSERHCRLHSQTIVSPDTRLQASHGWDYYDLCRDHTTTPWKLVFRATAGIGQSVWSAWTNAGRHDNYCSGATPPGCWTTNGQFFCDRHLRTAQLDNWHNVSEVQVLLYNQSMRVAKLVFNATGSTYLTWFSKKRIIDSPWIDLTPTSATNFDSIKGHHTLDRRFFLSEAYVGCNNDAGWMTISSARVCPWEKLGEVPVFIYSPETTAVKFSKKAKTADVMAIYVKLSAEY